MTDKPVSHDEAREAMADMFGSGVVPPASRPGRLLRYISQRESAERELKKAVVEVAIACGKRVTERPGGASCGICKGTGRVPLKTPPRSATPEELAVQREGWVRGEAEISRLEREDGRRHTVVPEQPSESGGRPIPSVKPLPDAPGWWVRICRERRGATVPPYKLTNVASPHLVARYEGVTWYGPLPLEKP